MPSRWDAATHGWSRRVFHYPLPTLMSRNFRLIELQPLSLTLLKMRKVERESMATIPTSCSVSRFMACDPSPLIDVGARGQHYLGVRSKRERNDAQPCTIELQPLSLTLLKMRKVERESMATIPTSCSVSRFMACDPSPLIDVGARGQHYLGVRSKRERNDAQDSQDGDDDSNPGYAGRSGRSCSQPTGTAQTHRRRRLKHSGRSCPDQLG